MSSDDDLVLYRVEEGVAVVTFNRPERLNAWTPAFGERYFGLLQRAANDPEVRAIVVTGAGRGFCAGADMDAIGENARSSQDGGVPLEASPWRTIEVPKPVIAAINGACVGLGLAFALTCDIRFAAEGARLGASFSRLGFVAEDGLSWILPRVIGLAHSLDLLLSGRLVPADEAKAMGLVNRVVPADGMLREAIDYAVEIAHLCSPAALAQIKGQVYAHAQTNLITALSESRDLTRNALRTEDVREGMASFAERRRPRFAGLSAPIDILGRDG